MEMSQEMELLKDRRGSGRWGERRGGGVRWGRDDKVPHFIIEMAFSGLVFDL